eukprot:RCo031059
MSTPQPSNFSPTHSTAMVSPILVASPAEELPCLSPGESLPPPAKHASRASINFSESSVSGHTHLSACAERAPPQGGSGHRCRFSLKLMNVLVLVTFAAVPALALW